MVRLLRYRSEDALRGADGIATTPAEAVGFFAWMRVYLACP